MPLENTQLGGGLFTGRAVHDPGVFSGIKEDVHDLVSLISPRETPLLNIIGDALFPARNVFHEWQEEELAPNAIITSVAVASTTADTALVIKGGLAAFLQRGQLLRAPEAAGGEYMQIKSVDDPTIVVIRAFAGTSANSFGANEFITVVSDAAVDGADVVTDISRPRPRIGNFTHIFKKDVIVSGTMLAVNQHGGIENEMDHQIQRRLAEALRDLEKAVILSRLSGNSIGSPANVRTMRGLMQAIATNVVSVSSIGTDFGTTTLQFFEARIDEAVRAAWVQGGTDLNLIICGVEVKRRFDQLNNQRIRVANQETIFSNNLTSYENTYGLYRVLLSRWMPPHAALILATGRLAVPPVAGRSFHYEPVAKTGDAEKGMVVGEYTLVHKNEAGMAQVSFASLAPASGQRLLQAP